MTRTELLGQSFECECGKIHAVGVESVVFREDACDALVPLVGRFAVSRVLNLVADVRTYDVAGERIRAALEGSGFRVHVGVLPDSAHGGPVCDDIGCSRRRFVEAFLHCHQIRERYTVVDLARAAGILPGAIHEIVEEWL